MENETNLYEFLRKNSRRVSASSPLATPSMMITLSQPTFDVVYNPLTIIHAIDLGFEFTF